MNIPIYVEYIASMSNNVPSGFYEVDSMDKHSIMFKHPETKNIVSVDRGRCTTYYKKDTVDKELNEQHKPLEVSHLFIKWYDIIKKSMKKDYSKETTIKKETKYKALEYLSAYDDGYNGKIEDVSFVDDNIVYELTNQEIKALSNEINTQKMAFIKAVLEDNFVKKERWIIAIKEKASEIMGLGVNNRFVQIKEDTKSSHEYGYGMFSASKRSAINITKNPIFTKQADATILDEKDLNEWLQYFRKHAIPVESKKL